MSKPISPRGAICLAVAGFTCFVLCDTVIKFAGQSNLPNYEIVASLGVFMTLLIALLAAFQGTLKQLWPKRPTRLLVRGLLDVGNNLCVVIALRHLSLTLFYILVFTSPLLVVLLGRLFLKETLDLRRAAAILTGFLGVVLAVYPSRTAGHADWIGIAACAVCVSCFSAAIVWGRVISQAERADSITFFSGLVSAAVGLAPMLVHAVPVTPRLLLALFVMALLGTIGSVCVFTALKYTTAATVSQFHYSQLVSGALVAYLFFREKPTLWMLAGATLIVASGLSIALRTPYPDPEHQD